MSAENTGKSDKRGKPGNAARLLRVILTVGPLIAFGCWLGLRGGDRPQMPPPFEGEETPKPVTFNSEGKADTEAFLKEISKSGSFEIIGGNSWKSRMELTKDKLDEALSKYRAAALADGFTEDKALDKSFAGLDSNTVFRAYRKEGVLRIVLIGSKMSADNPARPVTIFEGIFAAHVE